jgi:hypothetical protein
MVNVQWRISIARPGEWHVAGLRVEDTTSPQAMWPAFFNGLSVSRYPEVVEAAVQEIGAGSNAVGVTFPGDLDEFDLMERAPIPAGSVEIYCHSFTDEILPRVVFYQILLAFGSQLLERPGQSGEWYTALRVALQKLRTKISQDLQA